MTVEIQIILLAVAGLITAVTPIALALINRRDKVAKSIEQTERVEETTDTLARQDRIIARQDQIIEDQRHDLADRDRTISSLRRTVEGLRQRIWELEGSR